MMAAIEAGAEDVESDEEVHVIWCADTDLDEVSTNLEAELGESETTKLVWRPQTTTPVDLDTLQKLMKLVETLEDDDDVQSVTTNFEADDRGHGRLRRGQPEPPAQSCGSMTSRSVTIRSRWASMESAGTSSTSWPAKAKPIARTGRSDRRSASVRS